MTNNGDDRIELEQSNLVFSLIFENDGGEPKAAGEADGLRLDITFKNFDNPLGIAWSSEVGKISDRKLLLSIYVQTLGTAPTQSRLIAYTFSLGEQA